MSVESYVRKGLIKVEGNLALDSDLNSEWKHLVNQVYQ